MPQAVITVAGIVPPQPGKKQGKIQDTTGQNWNVWGDKLQNYRMGVTYNVTYTDEEFNNVQFKLIKNAEPAGQGASPRPEEPRAPIPLVPQALTIKDEMIFVCGAFNNLMSQTGAWDKTITEMATKVDELIQVFHLTLGKSRNGMNDSIPF